MVKQNSKIVFLFIISIATLLACGCKKGFVIKSSSIDVVGNSKLTFDTIVIKLNTDAYYKGKKIEPSTTNWKVKDYNSVSITPISANSNTLKWIPKNTGKFTISAEFTFDTKDNNTFTKSTEVSIFPNLTFIKSKVLGEYQNYDSADPATKFSIAFNNNFEFVIENDISNFGIPVFLHQNTFNLSGSINLTNLNSDGYVNGTITLTDENGNTRTDLIEDLIFQSNYSVLTFNQVYANDHALTKYLSINKK